MVLEKVLPIIFIFIAGFLLKKFRILRREDSKVLSRTLLYLVIPAVIINSLSRTTLDPGLAYIPISSLLVLFCLLFLGFFFSRLIKLEKNVRIPFIMAFSTLEIGSIGYAFMLAVFGTEGLARIVLFDSVNCVFLFTVVYMLSCSACNGFRMSDGASKLLRTPVVWAIVIGLGFNLVGFQNSFVFSLMEVIGGATLVLIMLLVGLEFEPSISSLKLPSITIFLKTVSGLALGILFSSLFGLSGLDRITVIVGSSLPPSICTLIFSEENRQDSRYLANLISIALPFGIIFVSALLNFL